MTSGLMWTQGEIAFKTFVVTSAMSATAIVLRGIASKLELSQAANNPDLPHVEAKEKNNAR